MFKTDTVGRLLQSVGNLLMPWLHREMSPHCQEVHSCLRSFSHEHLTQFSEHLNISRARILGLLLLLLGRHSPRAEGPLMDLGITSSTAHII